MAKEHDHLFKLVIIGDSGVGKSQLMLRFAHNTYADEHNPTMSVEFRNKTIEVDDEKVKLQIWDTVGEEKFRSITSTYYRRTHGVIVVYDVTKGETFEHIKGENGWLNEIDKYCEDVKIIIVGNKIDDPNSKVVRTEEAQRFADQMGLQFIETSAKKCLNVSEMFYEITKMILRSRKEQKVSQNNLENRIKILEESIKIQEGAHKKRRKKCC